MRLTHWIITLNASICRIKKKTEISKKSVRYLSVSLSLTLSRNKIVEQHIRKKIHNVLMFWVEGGIILLCGLTPVSFL